MRRVWISQACHELSRSMLCAVVPASLHTFIPHTSMYLLYLPSFKTLSTPSTAFLYPLMPPRRCMGHKCGVACDEEKVTLLLAGQPEVLSKYQQTMLMSYLEVRACMYMLVCVIYTRLYMFNA